jgi:hypothetical protein
MILHAKTPLERPTTNYFIKIVVDLLFRQQIKISFLLLDDEAEEDLPDDESPEKPSRKRKHTKGKKKKKDEEEAAEEAEEAGEEEVTVEDIEAQYSMYPAGMFSSHSSLIGN